MILRNILVRHPGFKKRHVQIFHGLPVYHVRDQINIKDFEKVLDVFNGKLRIPPAV